MATERDVEQQLADIRDDVARHESAIAVARRHRDILIRAAITEGRSPTAIAKVAGISRQAVYDILAGE